MKNSPRSADAAEYTEKLFHAVNEKYLQWKLRQQGVQQRLAVTRAEYKTVDSDGASACWDMSTTQPHCSRPRTYY